MNSKEFVKNSKRTESIVPDFTEVDSNFVDLLDLYVQLTNILDMYKKKMFYGKDINVEDQIEDFVDDATTMFDSGDGVKCNINSRFLHGVLGLATESGELVEALRKSFNSPLDVVNVKEEIGDIQWYEAILMDMLGTDWESIRTTVIKKLQTRYPEKFTKEDALDRDLDKEREVLENA